MSTRPQVGALQDGIEVNSERHSGTGPPYGNSVAALHLGNEGRPGHRTYRLSGPGRNAPATIEGVDYRDPPPPPPPRQPHDRRRLRRPGPPLRPLDRGGPPALRRVVPAAGPAVHRLP